MITTNYASNPYMNKANSYKRTNFIQVTNFPSLNSNNSSSNSTTIDALGALGIFNRNDQLFISNIESYADDIMSSLNDIKTVAKIEYSRALSEMQNKTTKITADEDKKMVILLAKQINDDIDKETDDEKTALRNYYMKKEQWYVPKEIAMRSFDDKKYQVAVIEKDDFGYPYIAKIIQDNGKTGSKRAMNIFSFSKDNVLTRYDDNVKLISDTKAQAKRSYVFNTNNDFECAIGQIFDENGDNQKPLQKFVFKDELLTEFHFLHSLPNGQERVLNFV